VPQYVEVEASFETGGWQYIRLAQRQSGEGICQAICHVTM